MSLMMEVSFKEWVKRTIKVDKNFGEKPKTKEDVKEWKIKIKIENTKNSSSMNSMISSIFQIKVMMQLEMIQKEQILN